ncbi:MAG: insulinase family protein [Saprospiraceae bacterium]|nr:insulinase family protein [Saprospiraceae bacterium]
MIEFSKFTLDNGLRVLVHEDHSTPMVAVNVLYSVGSRDESPKLTGFAHLFEHLMFGGSEHIPNFDDPIQLAGGENNAFTNNDITNYYELMPAENIEIAFWLESDRMLSLNFDKKVLTTQKKVVVEEFKETCLNQPYGDVWHHLAPLAYKKHPYRWPVIGIAPEHVESATMKKVKEFYFNYYRPNNAILVVAGKTTLEEVKILAEKWFAAIPSGKVFQRNLEPEPPQQELRRIEVEAEVPVDALYMAFHIPDRLNKDYYTLDLVSDLLCNGPSSRLYRRLLREQQLFSQIDCYISGNIDPGLLIIEGKPSTDISLEQAEQAIWAELEELKTAEIAVEELEKIKNKAESSLIFSEASVMNKAMNLAFFELMGDPDLINKEGEYYQNISGADILRAANNFLIEKNCSIVRYRAKEVATV